MRTTVTLHPDTITYLNDISRKKGIRRSLLLRLCMFQWFKNMRMNVRFFRKSVKYQNSADVRFKRVHVCFAGFEYESFLDSRKFLKRSVSSIAADAILKYAGLIEMTEENISIKMDTYPFPSYEVEREEKNYNVKWSIKWLKIAKGKKQRKRT